MGDQNNSNNNNNNSNYVPITEGCGGKSLNQTITYIRGDGAKSIQQRPVKPPKK